MAPPLFPAVLLLKVTLVSVGLLLSFTRPPPKSELPVPAELPLKVTSVKEASPRRVYTPPPSKPDMLLLNVTRDSFGVPWSFIIPAPAWLARFALMIRVRSVGAPLAL